jgi:copper(I)-binding protein
MSEGRTHRVGRYATFGCAAALSLLCSSTLSAAAELAVAKAWVAPTDAIGGDAVLSMIVTNSGADPDALVRAGCPFANFSEMRTIDHGEGAPAKRQIPNIPLPPHATVTMAETGYHVALLQVREKLVEGATFTCPLRFRNAGSMDVQVRVSRSQPDS